MLNLPVFLIYLFRPTITPSASITLKSREPLKFTVLAVSGCPNGVVKDIQVSSSNDLVITTKFEYVQDRSNELNGLITLKSNEIEVHGSTVCVKAIDDSDLNSSESCFKIYIESYFSLAETRRKKRDTTVIISQSQPLCSYSSFAVFFVYYWCMFIGMHILTLAFLVSYMLRSYYKFFEAKAFFSQTTNFSGDRTAPVTTSSTLNKEISYDPNTYDYNYLGFDNKNEQNGVGYETNGAVETQNKSSLLFPLPKREFF